MKLNYKSSPTFASDGIEVSKMGLATDSADMLTMFLRDKIYSNKILACVRETITNAIDEHVKHDIDRAVEVQLSSTDGKNVWSVRDYALGLSEDDVRNIYGMYGGSTKRHCNKQVGGFGIGALSPFAVSDTFYVTSHHNGSKTQYVCTLGAGSNGIPVGEIYKISEEPSTETGIEVSLEISDRWYFHSETLSFVKNLLPTTKIIYTDYGNSKHEPNQPQYSKVVGEYTINLYYSVNNYVVIRMGGVIYKSDLFISAIHGKVRGTIVVDVPIGKLTIPISRESLEETSKNTEVLDEISEIIKGMLDLDQRSIPSPKLGDFFLTNLNYSNTYETDWFKYSISDLFPNSWYVYRHRGYINPTFPKQKNSNNQYVIYLIPDIRTYRSWVKRLDTHMSKLFPNTCFTYVVADSKIRGIIENTDSSCNFSDVSFVDVKKLGLPKITSGVKQTAFVVYKNSRKYGSYTADELEENVSNGVELDPDWYKNARNYDELNSRTISLTADFGINCNWFVTNSKKLKADLIELGWIDRSSKEYKEQYAILKAEADKKLEYNRIQNNMYTLMFRVNPNKLVIQSMLKDAEKYNKFKAIRDKIYFEDSPRGRILQGIQQGYTPKLTRSDLRMILKLKA